MLNDVKNFDLKLPAGAAVPDDDNAWSRETALRGDLLVLEQIEALEDRVASASMQVKGWKLPARATTEMNLSFRTAVRDSVSEDDDHDDQDDPRVNPIHLAKDRLLKIEAAIERRYLKAPLGHRYVHTHTSVFCGTQLKLCETFFLSWISVGFS